MPLCLPLPLPCVLHLYSSFYLFCVGPRRTFSLPRVLCFSSHHFAGVVSSAFLNLAVSATILPLRGVSLSCQFFVGCHVGALHIMLGMTAFAGDSILLLMDV